MKLLEFHKFISTHIMENASRFFQCTLKKKNKHIVQFIFPEIKKKLIPKTYIDGYEMCKKDDIWKSGVGHMHFLHSEANTKLISSYFFLLIVVLPLKINTRSLIQHSQKHQGMGKNESFSTFVVKMPYFSVKLYRKLSILRINKSSFDHVFQNNITNQKLITTTQ